MKSILRLMARNIPCSISTWSLATNLVGPDRWAGRSGGGAPGGRALPSRRVGTREASQSKMGAHWDHEPSGANANTLASWSAAVLCRFWIRRPFGKRQRTGAVQNLAASTRGSWAVFTICLLCLSGAAFAAGFSELFQQGVQAYVAGGYEQAAGFFREAVVLSPSSGALHNLGNAEWQAGRVGEAVLAWERAQLLNPYSANTRANLRFARKVAQLEGPNLVWYEICSTWLPVNAWPWLAGASLWLAIAMVMLPGIFRWRKADWHQALAAGGFAVFLLTIPALIGVQTRSQIGVIRAKDTPLRLTPTREAQTMARLPAGEMARLERERGDYVYVRTGNDAAGWLHREQFGRVASR